MATKTTTKPNPGITKLVAGIESGAFQKMLDANDLTAGGLARRLGVEPAVVSKLAKGARAPRTNAPADSIAGKVAKWYVAAAKKAS